MPYRVSHNIVTIISHMDKTIKQNSNETELYPALYHRYKKVNHPFRSIIRNTVEVTPVKLSSPHQPTP